MKLTHQTNHENHSTMLYESPKSLSLSLSLSSHTLMQYLVN
jgi:hypothetical protein